jgi:hypothetical protein
MSTFEIADAFELGSRRNRDAPLPLGYINAVRCALGLRQETNMSYQGISHVMRRYHGWNRSPQWWSRELRVVGAEPRPRGIMCCGPDRIAA